MARKTTFVLCSVVLCLVFGLAAAAAYSEEAWMTVDALSGQVDYYGRGLTNWRKIGADEAYNGDEIYSDRNLHEAAFTFEGTAVRWIASVGPNRGKANVYIDGVLVAGDLDLYSEEMAYQVPVFEAIVDPGVHTIKVVPTGTKRPEAIFAAITVDAFQYIPSLSSRIAYAYELLRLAPPVPEVEQKLVSFDYPSEAIQALVLAISNALEANAYFAPGSEEQVDALVRLEKAMANFKTSKITIARPSLYSFDDNLDDSLGCFPAVAVGTLTYEDGVIGKAANLDGSVHIEIPADHPISTAEQMTVAAWVLWREGNQWQRILDFGNNTSQYFFITPNSGNNTLRFAITSGSGERLIETAPLPKNEWVHVAVTLGGGEAKLYVNGELADSGSISIVPNDFKPARNYVGKSQWPDPLFNGLIDELYISNVALSAEEIKALMGAQ